MHTPRSETSFAAKPPPQRAHSKKARQRAMIRDQSAAARTRFTSPDRCASSPLPESSRHISAQW